MPLLLYMKKVREITPLCISLPSAEVRHWGGETISRKDGKNAERSKRESLKSDGTPDGFVKSESLSKAEFAYGGVGLTLLRQHYIFVAG
nr:uncharacterized protein BN887_03265 [Melanopsichium pennsylvanicum 4]